MSPLAFALAVLPVASVRSLILPEVPCLAPLLEVDSGLLGAVTSLESCIQCNQLVNAVVAAASNGKEAAKRQRALNLHRSKHTDIDSVNLSALNEEVHRLCRESCEPAVFASLSCEMET